VTEKKAPEPESTWKEIPVSPEDAYPEYPERPYEEAKIK
jgi:hypothetical protein